MSDKDCEHIRPLLSGFLDGALAEGQDAQVTDHLAACAHCREHLAALERVDHVLGVLDAPVPPPAYLEELAERVRGRIAESASPAAASARAERSEPLIGRGDQGEERFSPWREWSSWWRGLFTWRRLTPVLAAAGVAIVILRIADVELPRAVDRTAPPELQAPARESQRHFRGGRGGVALVPDSVASGLELTTDGKLASEVSLPPGPAPTIAGGKGATTAAGATDAPEPRLLPVPNGESEAARMEREVTHWAAAGSEPADDALPPPPPVPEPAPPSVDGRLEEKPGVRQRLAAEMPSAKSSSTEGRGSPHVRGGPGLSPARGQHGMSVDEEPSPGVASAVTAGEAWGEADRMSEESGPATRRARALLAGRRLEEARELLDSLVAEPLPETLALESRGLRLELAELTLGSPPDLEAERALAALLARFADEWPHSAEARGWAAGAVTHALEIYRQSGRAEDCETVRERLAVFRERHAGDRDADSLSTLAAQAGCGSY